MRATIVRTWQKLTTGINWLRIIQYLTFASILFGLKLWLIGSYGNATPFWDQWDGEAALLYKPHIDGSLTFEALLAPHNEHRILTTRLLALTILDINHVWNPLLQMVVNALIHIITIAFGVHLLTKVVSQLYLGSLLVFSILLFGIPYGWENTLAGFQAQFYFVLFFSFACIWLLIGNDPFSSKWWGGLACAVLAFFSLASGVFAVGTAAAVGLYFYIAGLRRTRKQLISILVLLLLFGWGTYLTPNLEHNSVWKANSFVVFFDALKGVLGWPVSNTIVAAIARNLPALILTIWMIWKRPAATDRRWFLVGLVIWSVGQALSIAYGRATVFASSRYLDLFAVSLLVNFACLISLIQKSNYFQPPVKAFVLFAWTAIVFFPLGTFAYRNLPEQLGGKRDTSRMQELNTTRFLATGDLNNLKNKALLDIPYPDPDRLAMILSWPEIKAILPTNIGHLNRIAVTSTPEQTFIPNGYFMTTPAQPDTTVGSYTAIGDHALGEVVIQYASEYGGTIEFHVAGYPVNPGNKIEIEQNGQRYSVSINENPKESWSVVYAKVKPGKFSIVLTDRSDTSWIAAGTASIAGRLDGFTNRLIARYYQFLLLGLILLVSIITFHQTNKNNNAIIGEA